MKTYWVLVKEEIGDYLTQFFNCTLFFLNSHGSLMTGVHSYIFILFRLFILLKFFPYTKFYRLHEALFGWYCFINLRIIISFFNSVVISISLWFYYSWEHWDDSLWPRLVIYMNAVQKFYQRRSYSNIDALIPDIINKTWWFKYLLKIFYVLVVPPFA